MKNYDQTYNLPYLEDPSKVAKVGFEDRGDIVPMYVDGNPIAAYTSYWNIDGVGHYNQIAKSDVLETMHRFFHDIKFLRSKGLSTEPLLSSFRK